MPGYWVIVVCHNQDCPHYGVLRRMHWPYLGQGVYHRPDMYCDCGNQPEAIPDE